MKSCQAGVLEQVLSAEVGEFTAGLGDTAEHLEDDKLFTRVLGVNARPKPSASKA